jgi:hypothetical protein
MEGMAAAGDGASQASAARSDASLLANAHTSLLLLLLLFQSLCRCAQVTWKVWQQQAMVPARHQQHDLMPV